MNWLCHDLPYGMICALRHIVFWQFKSWSVGRNHDAPHQFMTQSVKSSICQISVYRTVCKSAQAPWLSLWESWHRRLATMTERADGSIIQNRQSEQVPIYCVLSYEIGTKLIIPTALSVAFGDSSPRGGAKGLVLTCKVFDKLKFADIKKDEA